MVGPLPDKERRWRWAAASRIGTSHLKTGTRKQDAYSISLQSGDGLCAVVSDGAGSASHGGQGASIVCRSLAAHFGAWLAAHERLPDDEHLMAWIDDLRDRLALAAQKRGLTRRQFAATLVLLAVQGDELLALQIGDSAIVGRRQGQWDAICWPENGEFASTTYFITDDPEVRLRTARLPLDYDGFALFSDGIETVALDHLGVQPHARFFDPMIRPVDQATGTGRLADLSDALGRYLDGAAICERTDDDKTLILISRA